jgi:hypothetical protein
MALITVGEVASGAQTVFSFPGGTLRETKVNGKVVIPKTGSTLCVILEPAPAQGSLVEITVDR